MENIFGQGLLGDDRFIETADSRRLRAMVAGDADDLVVLEAGHGVSGLYWGPVHERIAVDARVVAYERAGYGASTPAASEGRALDGLSSDLISIIEAIPHRRLVLVGHSWGGPIVRTAAARLIDHGRTPTGIVLVDQSDEHAAELYTSRSACWSDALQNSLMVPLARLRLLAPMMKSLASGLPKHFLDATLASSSTVNAARETVAENRHIGGELLRLRERPLSLGDTEIRVISGCKDTEFDRAKRARLRLAHRETVAQHPEATYVAAKESGHMVPITEPDLVASEALSLLK